MPDTSSVKRKPVKFLDVKVLLATASLAVTMGLWTLFSRDGLQAVQAGPSPESTPPPDQANTLDLPPLPTLVPLAGAPAQGQPSAAAQPGAAPQGAGLAQPLREVSAEENPVIIQKIKPVVDLAVPSGGGGGSQPVTSTRSSR